MRAQRPSIAPSPLNSRRDSRRKSILKSDDFSSSPMVPIEESESCAPASSPLLDGAKALKPMALDVSALTTDADEAPLFNDKEYFPHLLTDDSVDSLFRQSVFKLSQLASPIQSCFSEYFFHGTGKPMYLTATENSASSKKSKTVCPGFHDPVRFLFKEWRLTYVTEDDERLHIPQADVDNEQKKDEGEGTPDRSAHSEQECLLPPIAGVSPRKSLSAAIPLRTQEKKRPAPPPSGIFADAFCAEITQSDVPRSIVIQNVDFGPSPYDLGRLMFNGILRSKATITKLCLPFCGLTSRSLMILMAAIAAANESQHLLTELDLSHNLLTSDSLAIITTFIFHTKLLRLSLRGNCIGSSELVQRRSAEIEAELAAKEAAKAKRQKELMATPRFTSKWSARALTSPQQPLSTTSGDTPLATVANTPPSTLTGVHTNGTPAESSSEAPFTSTPQSSTVKTPSETSNLMSSRKNRKDPSQSVVGRIDPTDWKIRSCLDQFRTFVHEAVIRLEMIDFGFTSLSTDEIVALLDHVPQCSFLKSLNLDGLGLEPNAAAKLGVTVAVSSLQEISVKFNVNCASKQYLARLNAYCESRRVDAEAPRLRRADELKHNFFSGSGLMGHSLNTPLTGGYLKKLHDKDFMSDVNTEWVNTNCALAEGYSAFTNNAPSSRKKKRGHGAE